MNLKKIVNFADDKHFLMLHELLYQTQTHSDTIREVFKLKNKLLKNLALSVIKNKLLKNLASAVIKYFGEVSLIYLFVSNH